MIEAGQNALAFITLFFCLPMAMFSKLQLNLLNKILGRVKSPSLDTGFTVQKMFLWARGE